MSTTMTPPTDADQIVQLLDELRQLPEDDHGRTDRENKLFAILHKKLRNFLKPWLSRKFPGKVKAGTSAGLSELMQNLYVEVLEKRDDAFWKIETYGQLEQYLSKAVFRDMLDCQRRRQRRQQNQQQAADVMELFYEDRRERFERDWPVQWHTALEWLERWHASPDHVQRQKAQLLRWYYIDGKNDDEIARELKVTKKAAQQRRYRAGEELAQLAGES